MELNLSVQVEASETAALLARRQDSLAAQVVALREEVAHLLRRQESLTWL